ncbi:hypothetical protein SCZ71_11905 [Legionella pneumophila serogroup 1]|uniref:DUF4153 domain-containing protein n=1 Tax=Legionella pneumophila TaxID=446 RepID=A0A378KAU4_LEGPN|nr:hypothetical protein [Legionella pneumophila]ABQ55621.1 hypothetical protein LPC_1684 [Legionella pneumophila str. Corby]ADG25554.1 hypothetical protein lpa_03185 [Legionella pneumophila 2300/99 Alcoy]MCK1859149.1 hypothetical protein [Legionella pneumophila]MCO1452968.1 hypothetical protein [Legionella pneumophila]MCW8403080.1 hypothetical protein [Legionella pneumophila]
MVAQRHLYIFTLIGLLLGVTVDILIRYNNTTAFIYSVVTIFGVLFALTYNNVNLSRLIGTSFLLAFFLSIPLFPLKMDYSTKDYFHFFTFFVGFPFFIYVAHCFHYAYHHDNTWRVSYSSLFAGVWNTIPLLFIAFVFSSLANLLIALGSFVFKTVGNNYLWDLYFYNRDFKLISSTTLFFMGLGVGQQNLNIIHNMRFLLLRIMYYLFPFLAAISALYFILYTFHSISSSQEYINPLIVLIPLTTAGIIFFNAYFQDGTIKSDYPSWLKLSLRVYRVILFLLALMMTYKILSDSSLDTNAFIYLLVAVLFSFTYAITAFLNENQEKQWIYMGNIATAIFFIVTLFLCNLPYIPVEFTIGGGNAINFITSTLS